MVRSLKIAVFLFALIAFGCSKSDNEGPGAEVPAAITDAPFSTPESLIDSEELRIEETLPEPSEINDDGDDESGPNDNKVD